jgi:hypothetical protein
LTAAQRASYNSLRWIAGEASNRIIVSPPEPIHAGEYASVLVHVVARDPTVKADPDQPLTPQNQMEHMADFLIEAGGCIARVLWDR